MAISDERVAEEPLQIDFDALERATADTSERGEAYFARAARAWIPMLLAEVKRLRAENERLEKPKEPTNG